ncbi:MAG: lamin tail domain-containing protein [Candidatus Aenigmarchaeota archaeon]|nr:lamin tail domain-containing protein [Candidatus Aenigmarchaeota archaeon]
MSLLTLVGAVGVAVAIALFAYFGVTMLENNSLAGEEQQIASDYGTIVGRQEGGTEPTATQDLCAGVECAETRINCPNGAQVACRNACSNGMCSNCTPQCGAASAACQPEWECGTWSACVNGSETRVCVDQNGCDNDTRTQPRPCQSAQQVAGKVDIVDIQFSSGIDDRKKENWNGEWVLLEGSNVDMTGWKLADAGSHEFTFPVGFVLTGQVKLHSGDGQNTASDLYWNCCRRPIWNNDGDKATLKDAAGAVVDEFAYG